MDAELQIERMKSDPLMSGLGGKDGALNGRCCLGGYSDPGLLALGGSPVGAPISTVGLMARTIIIHLKRGPWVRALQRR